MQKGRDGAAPRGKGILTGRRAIITGASRGIGFAIAQALVDAGAHVAMLARGAEGLIARATELNAAGPGEAIPVPCDVTKPEAVTAALATITDAWDEAPDILINNAGIFNPRPLDVLTPAEFADTMQANLISPFLLVHAVLPSMRERRQGHIVTIGSVADRVAFPENGAYSASKFGLRALHEVMRAELKGSGVRTTLVSPGATDTSIWDASGRAGTGRFPTRSEMMPPTAVAAAVLYAVSQPACVNVDELRLTSA